MMQRFMRSTWVAAGAILCLSFSSPQVRADQVTDVVIPYSVGSAGCCNFYGSWAGALGGSTIVTAPKSGNAGSGITFANWDGHFNEVDQGSSTTLTLAPVALTANSVVNSLFNTFYGSASVNAVITFGDSNGDTATYSLYGDQTIRDYNQAIYANDLQGYNTVPSGPVTAQNWWGSATPDGFQRLDVQTFVLPTAWAGANLTSITINDPGTSGADVVLSALQVDNLTPAATVTPEPSSLALLGTGLLGVYGATRRRFQR